MNKTEDIKEKIKKLFALANSSNTNESSIALKKAQELMIENNITNDEIIFFDIVEQLVKRNNNSNKITSYESYLICKISEAFACKILYNQKYRKIDSIYKLVYSWKFIGLEHHVEIAIYITTILFRKLKKARQEYINNALRKVRKRNNKTLRADNYCLGWVYSVCDNLEVFSGKKDEDELLEKYMEKYPSLESVQNINRKTINKNDKLNGMIDGSLIELQSGVNQADNKKYIK